MSSRSSNISDFIKQSLRESSTIPLVMVFVAPWSPFSDAVKTIADKVKFVRDDVKVLVIDIDQYPDEKSTFDIRKIPTFIFIENQEIKFKKEEMMSKKEILQLIR